MARVVRKVSNKNIANANKNKKVNKWLIGGIIAGVVVAIAVAIVLWVTLGGSEEENKVNYFETSEVEFTHANYAGLINLMDENYVGYVDGVIIVLAYNSESFAPEFDENNEPANDDAKLLRHIEYLQGLVNTAKAADCNIELFLVDISVSSNEWGIMGDSDFGGSTSIKSEEEAAYVEPLLAVIDNTAEEKLVKKCSQSTLSKILNTGIENTENLINSLLN